MCLYSRIHFKLNQKVLTLPISNKYNILRKYLGFYEHFRYFTCYVHVVCYSKIIKYL